MATRAAGKKTPKQAPIAEDAKASGRTEHKTGRKARNIAVAYEPVELTEKDAEVLREVSENPEAAVGRPARPPRKMPDK